MLLLSVAERREAPQSDPSDTFEVCSGPVGRQLMETLDRFNLTPSFLLSVPEI